MAVYTNKVTREIAQLESLGFTASANKRPIHVTCDQCQALVINGTATHEHGCPNARHECHGCNELIPVNQKYCEDCQ